MEGLDEFLNKYKVPIGLSFVGLVLIIGGIFSSGLVNNFSSAAKDTSYIKSSPKGTSLYSPSSSEIKVDISGAVLNPGVYSLNKDARVEDALKAAGGFSATASAEYISKQLNLSQKLSDGQKIYIPYQGEPGVSALQTSSGQVAGASAVRVGINTATSEQLDSLPGVGAVTAQKIISGRPYQSLEELVSKKAVGKSTFDKIKDLIDLN